MLITVIVICKMFYFLSSSVVVNITLEQDLSIRLSLLSCFKDKNMTLAVFNQEVINFVQRYITPM